MERARRGAWRAAFLVTGILLCVALARLPGPLGWVMLAISAAGVLAPASVLLILAAILPIANSIGAAAGLVIPLDGPLACSLLAGAALRWTVRDEGIGAVPASVPVLALVVLSSFVVQAAVMHERIGPDTFQEQLRWLVSGGLFDPAVDLDHQAAAAWLQGLALLGVTLKILHAHPRWRTPLVRMLAVGGAAVAAMNAMRLASVWLSSPDRVGRASELLPHLRVDTQFADVNGAGSFFVLVLGCAVGAAAGARRLERAGYATACGTIVLGLWLTRSRAAFLAAVVTAVVGVFVSWRRRGGIARVPLRPAAAVVAILASLAVGTLMLWADGVMSRGSGVAIQTRRDMAVASVRLFRTAPLFGVGIGNFFERSAEVIQDLPVRAFYARENAHNNFLQVLAELGAIGFVCFVLVLGTMYRRAWGTLRGGAATPEALGAVAGVTAFLLSALLGHPLLIPPIAYVFWIAIGTVGTIGPGGGRPGGEAAGLVRHAVPAVIALVVVATVPLRVRGQIASLSLEHYGYGLSMWQTDPSGARYRVADGAATVFVPGHAQLSEIPLFVANAAGPVTVSISIGSRVVNRVTLPPDTWVRYRLPTRERPERAYVPVTIDVEGPTRGELRIGKVAPVAGGR